MRTRLKRNHPEAGVALIIALLVLLILSVLAASIIFVTQTETWATANNRSMVQARYAAEAGAQKTLNYLRYTYPTPANLGVFDQTKYPLQYNGGDVILSAMTGVNSNYPDAAVQNAFNAALKDASVPGVGVPASYEVQAKLLSIQGPGVQTWEITSQGNVPSIRNAQVQVVMKVERTSASIPMYAVFATDAGCGALIFSGGGGTDSFDSRSGPYGAGNNQQSDGNIGTNGNVNLSGGGGTPLSKTIFGTISTPKSGTGSCNAGSPDALTVGTGWNCGGQPTCSGDLNPISPTNYPIPPAPVPNPGTTVQNVRNNCSSIGGCSCYPGGGYACTNSGPYNLTPGDYDNVVLGGGKTMHVSAGTYNFNSLNLSGGAVIIVDSGPVTFNAATNGISAGTCCAYDFSGGSVSNMSGTPSNLMINYGGQAKIVLSGGSGAYEVINAPDSGITISGGGELFGAVIGKTVNNSGGSAVHYDRALDNLFTVPGPYYPISFTWSKF